MTVNSMLRTVAQQYLLYRWYQSGTCGIGLAAKPGNSNHETGLAIDISQYSTWKGTLQAHGFSWLGSSDPVHFDYSGAGAKSYKGMDVKAFQRLWNRNHADDKISADGIWGPQTEARMKKAPAAGFKTGATCGSSPQSAGMDDVVLAAGEGESEDEALAFAQLVYASGGDDAHVDDAVSEGVARASGGEGLFGELAGEIHGSATEPSADDEACSSCFFAICQADSYCCDTEWDDRCVSEGMELCEMLCGKDAMAPL